MERLNFTPHCPSLQREREIEREREKKRKEREGEGERVESEIKEGLKNTNKYYVMQNHLRLQISYYRLVINIFIPFYSIPFRSISFRSPSIARPLQCDQVHDLLYCHRRHKEGGGRDKRGVGSDNPIHFPRLE